jgi:hypothetical protein
MCEKSRLQRRKELLNARNDFLEILLAKFLKNHFEHSSPLFFGSEAAVCGF